MKRLSDAEEKPFTSSLNICPETATLFPSQSVDISFKDYVTVILLLGVSFM
jgi:hypothetical protein